MQTFIGQRQQIIQIQQSLDAIDRNIRADIIHIDNSLQRIPNALHKNRKLQCGLTVYQYALLQIIPQYRWLEILTSDGFTKHIQYAREGIIFDKLQKSINLETEWIDLTKREIFIQISGYNGPFIPDRRIRFYNRWPIFCNFFKYQASDKFNMYSVEENVKYFDHYFPSNKRSIDQTLNELFSIEDEEKEDGVYIIDEVIFKKEIKIEPNDITEEHENDIIEEHEEEDDDVIYTKEIKGVNENIAIDLALADDAHLLVKFCPKCRIQWNRSLEDIQTKCGTVICYKCSPWTYWCWDCCAIIDEKRKDMRCINCRRISRDKRNCN